MKKYKLTDEKIEWYGRTLHRIIALMSFGNVKEGDLGGFIEKEENLSHYNNCWVFGEAQVCDEAQVYGEARVYGEAQVYGEARVCDEAQATTIATTFGNGFRYCITITDKHIKIGCQQHLKSEWLYFTNREILDMDGRVALEFWNIFKPMGEKLGIFKEV